MKKILFVTVTLFFLQLSVSAQRDFVLNNPVMAPAPAVFPGKLSVTFDFFVAQSPFTFSNTGTSSTTIVFNFRKLDPTGINPTGTGAALFTWVLTNNGGTGVNKIFTYTGTTKNVTMNQAPPSAKYKITFSDLTLTFAATNLEADVRVDGVFTDPAAALTGITGNNSSSISTYTSTGGSLPVTLNELQGKYNRGISYLNWSTTSEVNLFQFEIERSTDALQFNRLGSVKAKGFSSSLTGYQFNDLLPAEGKNYYRLKMIDADGVYRYSNTILLNVNTKGISISGVYPNPFTDRVQVNLSVENALVATVKVIDYTGRLIRNESFSARKGANKFTLSGLDKLPGGLFLVEVSAGNETKIIKLVK